MHKKQTTAINPNNGNQVKHGNEAQISILDKLKLFTINVLMGLDRL